MKTMDAGVAIMNLALTSALGFHKLQPGRPFIFTQVGNAGPGFTTIANRLFRDGYANSAICVDPGPLSDEDIEVLREQRDTNGTIMSQWANIIFRLPFHYATVPKPSSKFVVVETDPLLFFAPTMAALNVDPIWYAIIVGDGFEHNEAFEAIQPYMAPIGSVIIMVQVYQHYRRYARIIQVSANKRRINTIGHHNDGPESLHTTVYQRMQ